MNLTNNSPDLLERVIHTYAKCRSFQCSAQQTRRIATHSITKSRFFMRLAFARPQHLFLQWWLDDQKGSKHHTLISNGDTVVRFSWAEMEWQQEPSCYDALASYAGISSGLALHIPSLLVGCDGYSLFERVDRQAKQTEQTTYAISGIARGDIERTIVVRTADMAIVKMHEKYAIPNGTVECESEYSDIELLQAENCVS